MSAETNNDIHPEVEEFLNSDFIPSTIDLTVDNEPNQPLPAKNEDKDDFDRLLDEFISSQLEDCDATQEETLELEKNKKPLAAQLNDNVDEYVQRLYAEERQLYDAYHNFTEAVKVLAQQADMETPAFTLTAEDLYPRYRPSRGQMINQNVLLGWDVMLQSQPTRLASLPAQASDEQILEFAEKTTNESLQLALISYVEILIELEGCEIAYFQRKAKAEKRKIERRLYEEHQERKEKMQRYIEAIKKQKFPIDAERLVGNYFKTARKDPVGAQKMLENNPATFSPILIEKIPARFFGMIKPKPEDGIKINKEIGKFMKKLKA